jgi:hypothetical protein
MVAAVAFVDVCAERAGAAGLDGVQRAALFEAWVVLGAVVSAAARQHALGLVR